MPPYSPELHPVEHLWDKLREKAFANRVFDTIGAVITQAARRMQDNPTSLHSLIGWEWILKLT
ncbi:MAG: hypothetical protein WCK32_08100 [Chlorobiaceae bacterium]